MLAGDFCGRFHLCGKWKLFQGWGGEQRHGVTLRNLLKTEVINKTAAKNLNSRQEQGENYVEFIQRGRRITELERNILGTSLAVEYRILMSPRFWVLCNDLKHGPGYCLATGTNKSIKLFNKN
jgi:hypothetical protein